MTALSGTFLFSGISLSNTNEENTLPINVNTAEAATTHTEFVKYISSEWAKVSEYSFKMNSMPVIIKADKKKYSKLAQYRKYKYSNGKKVTLLTYYTVKYK